MATTIAQLQAVISADTSGFTKGISDAQEKTKGFGGTLSDIGKSAAGFALAQLGVDSLGGAIDTLKGFIDAGREAAQVQAQTNAVLVSTKGAAGESAAAISDLATNISNMSGIDDQAVQTGENMLLTFTNIGKNVFPQATQAIADMATKMNGGAIPSSQQLQQQAVLVGKALNDPIKGLTALQRVGVTFDDQQKKQIATMIKAGDTAGAQKVILGELSKEFGGSAAAAGNADGGVAKFQNSLHQMQEAIGTAILPALGKIVTALTPLINQLATALPPALQQVGNLFAFLGQHMDVVLPLLAGVAIAIAAAVVPAFFAWAASAWAAAAGVIAATWPVLAIGVAIGGLIFLLVQAYNHFGFVRAVVDTVRNSIGLAIGTIASLVGWLADHLGPILQKIGSFIGGAFMAELNGLKAGFDIISNAVGTLIGWIGNLLGKLGQVKDAIGGALGGIGNAISHIPGFAGGTDDAPGGFAMVGEHGPELMYVPSHAKIYPAGTGPQVVSGTGASGGKSVSIGHLHVYGDDADSTARAVVSELNWQSMLYS